MSTVIIAAWRKSLSRCNEPTGQLLAVDHFSCERRYHTVRLVLPAKWSPTSLSGKGEKKTRVEGAIETKSADGLHLDSRDIFFPTPFPFEAAVTVPVSMLGYGGGDIPPIPPPPWTWSQGREEGGEDTKGRRQDDTDRWVRRRLEHVSTAHDAGWTV